MTHHQGRQAPPSDEGHRWCLFARVLEDVLREQGYRLRQITARTAIHPAKVARLQASLEQQRPKQFPLLPKEEIDEVARAFHLEHDQYLRLYAAALATATERVLMNSLDPENALQAAEQLMPVLLDTLRQHAGERDGLGAYVQQEPDESQ